LVIIHWTLIYSRGVVALQREKEAALEKILQLEKQLDAKQKLELEIQQLKGQLQVMKHMGGEEDSTVRQKMEDLTSELNDKIEEMEDMEALNQTLVVKERKSNDELQEARKELISVRSFLAKLSFTFLFQ
jgi:chromosome segregation ATPase